MFTTRLKTTNQTTCIRKRHKLHWKISVIYIIVWQLLNIFTSSEPSGLLGEHSAYLCSGVPQPFPKNDKYIDNRREGGIITLRPLTTDSAIKVVALSN